MQGGLWNVLVLSLSTDEEGPCGADAALVSAWLKCIPVASVLKLMPYGEGLKQKSAEVLMSTVFWH